MNLEPRDIPARLRRRLIVLQNRRRIAQLTQQVKDHEWVRPGQRPVVFFNASTRLTNLSQNSAFATLTSWALRLSGVPVVHFVCESGMSRCVLGTNPDNPAAPPPCKACIEQSHRITAHSQVRAFTYQADPILDMELDGLSVQALSKYQVPAPFAVPGSVLPLGPLVLPSLRWALRRHTLEDDEPTRFLLREYISSAYRVVQEFATFLSEVQPETAVIFNGIMYPEAMARWVALQRGVRVITHEVGFQRYSAFFSDGEATAYPLDIPEDFELDAAQNARLDAYLEDRFQGKFTMAGIQFWPEMSGLDPAFREKAAGFRQVVPVFTNVIFDTSQIHANTVFPHMFAWLDMTLELIRAYPETLFVIRAHPDEMRPGSNKQSRESVQDWVEAHGVTGLPNVVFISPQEYISSYELIQSAKFSMVYNSSIGLEAALMGKPVLTGGKARYTQYPTVFFPENPEAYFQKAEELLLAEQIQVPAEFQRQARRFIYYQFYRGSLPFEDFLQSGVLPGYVELKPFSWKALLPENSPTLRVLVEGISNPAASPEPGENQLFILGDMK